MKKTLVIAAIGMVWGSTCLAGDPYKHDSPNNPYGQGIGVYGDDDG